MLTILNCILFICVLSFVLANNDNSALQLEAPDTILPNEHFETKCWGSGMVRMHVHHCPSVRLQQTCTDGEFCEILHVTHVEKACEVTCVSGSKVLQKKILVKEGIITSETHNITMWKEMPFTLNCTSRCRSGLCQVMWTTNKMFVKNGKEYTIRSTPPFKDTQSHHLTVHSASSSTDYQCLLIDVTGRIIDSVEQHVEVKESDNTMVTRIINYVKSYFQWAS